MILITNNSTVSEENPLVAETVLFLKEKELKDCKEQISRNFPIIINSAMKKQGEKKLLHGKQQNSSPVKVLPQMFFGSLKKSFQ